MKLINIIKADQNLRKIFGKREITIIQKQLLGVRLKDSERTRLSRDIRKKLEAVKELSNFSGEFELKKGAEIKRIIDEAKEVISQSKHFSNIKRIWLFGSAVQDRLTLTSDIDMAVEFIGISKREATKFRSEIFGRVNQRVDIQVYNTLPDKVKKEILNSGRTIYEQAHRR